MVAIVKFDVLFTIIFSIFWYILPYMNIKFILASETFQYNMIQSNIWAIWICAMVQYGFIFLSWNIQSGGFPTALGLTVNPMTMTLALLDLTFYGIQATLFVGYTYARKSDMGLWKYYA